MASDNAHRLATLSSQLAETLMTAAICAQEIRAAAHAEVVSDHPARVARRGAASSPQTQRPLLDDSTLCVIWKGRSLYLGHTLSFGLLARLSRRPNQHVTHLDLLREVWNDDFVETTAVRSAVRRLRTKLRGGGMSDLAAIIHGHNGRYVLAL